MIFSLLFSNTLQLFDILYFANLFSIIFNYISEPMNFFCSTDLGLVVWGQPGALGTTFDLRWSDAERALWTIDGVPPYLLGVIVGLIISDGNLQLKPLAVNAYLRFQQSMSHFPYFYMVFGTRTLRAMGGVTGTGKQANRLACRPVHLCAPY